MDIIEPNLFGVCLQSEAPEKSGAFLMEKAATLMPLFILFLLFSSGI